MPKLLLTLVIFSLLATQVIGVKTSGNDLAYLRRFAAATGADQAIGWNTSSDPCDDGWSGVDCDNSGKVTVIDIQDKGLLGTVPDAGENGSLSMLEDLIMGGNGFTGSVPMLPLPHLQYLRLDGNYFTAMPEKFFMGMPGLRDFNMSNNTALAGWALSEKMRSLTQLRHFEASAAGIIGTLDVLFRNSTAGFPFPNLLGVSLAANRLNGTMPEIKGSAITKLDLSNNKLSGPISFISDLAPSVEYLILSHNRFTGPMPDFTNFKGLYFLSVDNNKITGVVPASLAQLSGIAFVYLSGNFLQGPVPEFEFDRYVQTDVTKAAARGSFCRLDHGPCAPEVQSLLQIAGAFGYPHSFAASWLRNDACAGWIGVHCDDRRRVTGINLSRFGLNGNMDSAFGSLLALEAILLTGNNIVGEIPASVAQLPALHVIDVSNNNLAGTIPKFRDDVAVWTEGNPGLKISGSSLSTPSIVGVLVALAVTVVPFLHV